MRYNPLLFQRFDKAQTQILRRVRFRIGNDDIHISRFGFTPSIATADFVDGARCHGFRCISHNPPDFLDFRPRYFMLVEFLVILDPDLLNPGE